LCAGSDIADPCRLFQPVQRDIQEQWTDDATNAMGNFTFEVTLSYRLPAAKRHTRPRVTDSM